MLVRAFKVQFNENVGERPTFTKPKRLPCTIGCFRKEPNCFLLYFSPEDRVIARSGGFIISDHYNPQTHHWAVIPNYPLTHILQGKFTTCKARVKKVVDLGFHDVEIMWVRACLAD